jgi:UDP-MurNAc hydroxylase
MLVPKTALFPKTPLGVELMEILWVNHAAFVIESRDIRLLIDPWLFGTAFNDSWDLLVPSQFEPKDFETVTHLWFSHEHPDHFATPVLNKVPEAARGRMTVLFQETRDHRVVNHCRKMGFTIIRELPIGKSVSLGPDFSVTCGTVPFYDSWLACQAEGITVLNLNDCVLESRRGLQKIHDRFGPIEVLFAQFSYASWFGGPEQTENYRQAALSTQEQLLQEIDVIAPRYVVPCASYVRFSHVENQHLNLHANKIGSIFEAIVRQGVSTPVVLFPGNTWRVGSRHESKRAIQLYEVAADEPFVFRKSKTIRLEEILSLSKEYRQRLLDRNSKVAIWLGRKMGLLPRVFFHVEDLNVDLYFDWADGLNVNPNHGNPDVTLSSDALAYLFRFTWGLDTLQVSARFSATKAGFRKLLRTFGLGSLNNMGLTFGIGLAANTELMRRAIVKILRAR